MGKRWFDVEAVCISVSYRIVLNWIVLYQIVLYRVVKKQEQQQ